MMEWQDVDAISIHALRGEGDPGRPGRFQWPCISIHALRGEGDGYSDEGYSLPPLISIHALRGEGDCWADG